MKRSALRMLLCVWFVVALSGCASLESLFATPQVTLKNLQLVEYSGLSATFRVDLAVANPNPVAIPVAGLGYELNLDGNRVISGVASNVGEIGAYASTDVTVEATTNFLGMVAFFTQLMSRNSDGFDYQLNTDISVTGWNYPLTYSDTGRIPLTR